MMDFKSKLASGYYTARPAKPAVTLPTVSLSLSDDEWNSRLARRERIIDENEASRETRRAQWEAACVEQAKARRAEFIEDLAAHCGSRSMAEKCLTFALAEDESRNEDEEDGELDDGVTYDLAVRLAEHLTGSVR